MKNKTLASHLAITALLCSMLFNINVSMADEGGNACGVDYKKFCANVKPGDGRIGKCLMQHKEEISQPCRSFFQQATKNLINEFVAACQTDVASNCKGVQSGEGRILNCLRDHNENISDDCKVVIKKL